MFPPDPLRLRVSVPITFALLTEIITLAPQLVPADRCTAIIAAMVLTYALSLRPGEVMVYPYTWAHSATHVLSSSQAFFVFPPASPSGATLSVPIYTPSRYPAAARPIAFQAYLDSNKNHPDASGGLRALVRAPSPHSGPELLDCLYDFLRAHPPAVQSPVLSGFHPPVTAAEVSRLLHAATTALGHPGLRVSPRSFRSGVPTTLGAAGFPESAVLAQGAWLTRQGMAPYLHPTLALFSSFAPVIQNPSVYPLSELLTTYDATRHPTPTMGDKGGNV